MLRKLLTKFGLGLVGDKLKFEKLRKLNLLAAGLHGLQGVLILALSNADRGMQPVTTNYLAIDKLASDGAGQPVLTVATRHLFDINLAYIVAAFFFVSALVHILVSTKYRRRYQTDLAKQVNKFRWLEYVFSAGLMMVAIALLSGMYELSALIMVFGLIALMNVMGLFMELYNKDPKKLDWRFFKIGAAADLVAWLAIGIYLLGAHVYGSGVPGFVYFIYASLFILFNCFALNMYLQYKRRDRWADYLYGEKVYIALSLVAKSALAWQIFAGSLR